jgi:formamidopyrimidine-DNA glycosylase
MPELPEVETIRRYLEPRLAGRCIDRVIIRHTGLRWPVSPTLRRRLTGQAIHAVERRAKYLLLRCTSGTLILHLGMTGRMYVAPKEQPLPKHAAVVLELCRGKFIYEDTRYFGRLTLDLTALATLGPEPLDGQFTVEHFARELKRSRQPVKVKLLDQSLVAGVGNIYASEALFRAGISPRLPAARLTLAQAKRLHHAIREVLTGAIGWGRTIPLNFSGGKKTDGLFYFGRAEGTLDYYVERLLVYDRAGKPCVECGASIRRIVQAARSTFYCPHCQKS